MSIACADRQGFRASLGTAHVLIRRERRPLPFCDVDGIHYRRWAADSCAAEVRHAADDFWACVHRLGLANLFDRDDGFGGHEAPFRLPHEIHAFAALGWLSHLQAHESDRNGPWASARWRTWDTGRRRDWFARRRYLWSGFVRQVERYRAACRQRRTTGQQERKENSPANIAPLPSPISRWQAACQTWRLVG